MKNKIRMITAFLILTIMMAVLPITANAAGSASLTGTAEVRAGDTLTLTFSISGDNLYGLTAEVEYDSSKLTLTGSKQLIASPWIVETNGATILAYDNNQTNPIKTEKKVFSLTFKVSSKLSAGEKISVKVKNIVASAGVSDIPYSNAVYSATLLGAKSSVSSLSSLSVSGSELSPKFDPKTYNYSVPAVPFNITELNISAKATDSKATCKITNNTLNVGQNKVSITVTAENGSKTVYTISVVREQDPNYKASDDATLSSIKVSKGTLSPVFSSEIKEYIVFIPYEEDQITVSATPSDEKASQIDDITQEVIEGDNVFFLTCTAEDGMTEETYTVHVFRMPIFKGTVPVLNYDDYTVDSTTDNTGAPDSADNVLTDSSEQQTTNPVTDGEKQSEINSKHIYITTAVSAVTLVIGVVLGILIKKSRQ